MSAESATRSFLGGCPVTIGMNKRDRAELMVDATSFSLASSSERGADVVHDIVGREIHGGS
jgi:hypothetical protein